MNYFDIISLPFSYDIDKNIANKNYLELQKILHSGKSILFHGRQLTHLDANEAYKILLDDYD